MKEGKEAVPTREPDLKMELKRGSMRDKWGLTLVHRLVPPNRWLVAYLCRHFLSTMNNFTITHPDPPQDG